MFNNVGWNNNIFFHNIFLIARRSVCGVLQIPSAYMPLPWLPLEAFVSGEGHCRSHIIHQALSHVLPVADPHFWLERLLKFSDILYHFPSRLPALHSQTRSSPSTSLAPLNWGRWHSTLSYVPCAFLARPINWELPKACGEKEQNLPRWLELIGQWPGIWFLILDDLQCHWSSTSLSVKGTKNQTDKNISYSV